MLKKHIKPINVKDAINTSLRKLEKYGYLKRQQTKDYNGVFAGYDYFIKIPPLADSPEMGLPICG